MTGELCSGLLHHRRDSFGQLLGVVPLLVKILPKDECEQLMRKSNTGKKAAPWCASSLSLGILISLTWCVIKCRKSRCSVSYLNICIKAVENKIITNSASANRSCHLLAFECHHGVINSKRFGLLLFFFDSAIFFPNFSVPRRNHG